ncbi:hypothetical protein BGZ65_012634 [Modicella reniformis]|uniref:Uncharacterized protein n=1 Tax=Modicella reniformis TaxID=1440133 RepID=A0A9P6M1K1_9FUNG|nr:hypothetical protein BGZ65_012634 [Modicella reniformis]
MPSDQHLHDWGKDREWRFFERIIAEYEVLRTNFLIDSGCKEATLGNIYKGALGRAETLKVTVHLKELSLVKATHQFPKMGGLTVDGQERDWKSDVVVQNADRRNPGILCALQAKKLVQLPANTLTQEHTKNTMAIVNVLEGSTLDKDGVKRARTITVIITTADADSALQTFGETFPEDCLLIRRGSFAEFFGEAFSVTAAFAATSDRNVNFSGTSEKEAQAEGRGGGPGYEEHAISFIRRPCFQSTEMEFLPYEELGRARKRPRVL